MFILMMHASVFKSFEQGTMKSIDGKSLESDPGSPDYTMLLLSEEENDV